MVPRKHDTTELDGNDHQRHFSIRCDLPPLYVPKRLRFSNSALVKIGLETAIDIDKMLAAAHMIARETEYDR